MSPRSIRRVLVTGGAGFLGSRIVQSYLGSGASVRAVGRTRPRSWPSEEVGRRIEFAQLDLGAVLDSDLRVFADQDLVIHTAAVLHAGTSAERALQERVNVEGTRNVIDACRRHHVPFLIHISTTAAIGISPDSKTPADEAFEYNLDHLDLAYNNTKHQAERLVLDANGSDFETIIVNPGFIFGRHDDGYRGIEVIERVLRRSLVLCTNGGLSVVHVGDVVEGIRRIAASGRSGQRYILSGENLSFREIARTVARVSGERKVVITVPDVARDLAGLYSNSRFARRRGSNLQLHLDRRYAYPYYSSDKARGEVGYQPRPFANIVSDALGHIGATAPAPTVRSAELR